MKKICMVVQNPMVKGGIAAVINGYRGSRLEKDYRIIYVESYRDGGKLLKLLWAVRGYLQFMKVLLWDRPELVHIHSSFGASFYRKIPFIYMASWGGIPIVNHIHGADFDEFYTKVTERKKRLIRKIYAKCTALIALSEEWLEQLSQIVPDEKIIIIENYSVVHKDAAKQRQERKSNDKVLFLGEIGKRKGCYDIPIIVKKVVKEVPEVQFVLGGSGTAEEEEGMKTLVRKYGVEAHVAFPGWVRGTDKERLLCEADVYFLPSYQEGMPMSVLDAMGYGLPVVSTKVGAIPRIVREGENGFCCEAGDIEALSSGIIALLSDKKLRDVYGRTSMQIVEQQYSLDRHLRKLELVYERVLSGSC